MCLAFASATQAVAQVEDHLGLFATPPPPTGICWVEADTGLVTVDVVHGSGYGLLSSVTFSISNATTMVYVDQACPPGMVCSGDARFGVSVTTPCVYTQGPILELTFWGDGTSMLCSALQVERPVWLARDGYVDVDLCGDGTQTIKGGWFVVRPNQAAGCSGCNLISPVESSNWGRIKALFER